MGRRGKPRRSTAICCPGSKYGGTRFLRGPGRSGALGAASHGTRPGPGLPSQLESHQLSLSADARASDTERGQTLVDAFMRSTRSVPPLIAGDKTGDDRWYGKFVPVADRLFEEH